MTAQGSAAGRDRAGAPRHVAGQGRRAGGVQLPQDGGLAKRVASLFTRGLEPPGRTGGRHRSCDPLPAAAAPHTPVAVPARAWGSAQYLPGPGAGTVLPEAPAGNPAATAALAAEPHRGRHGPADVPDPAAPDRPGGRLARAATQQREPGQFDFAVGASPTRRRSRSTSTPRAWPRLLPDILAQPISGSDFVLSLAHTLYYVIPMGLGDCYTALGDWPTPRPATCGGGLPVHQHPDRGAAAVGEDRGPLRRVGRQPLPGRRPAQRAADLRALVTQAAPSRPARCTPPPGSGPGHRSRGP